MAGTCLSHDSRNISHCRRRENQPEAGQRQTSMRAFEIRARTAPPAAAPRGACSGPRRHAISPDRMNIESRMPSTGDRLSMRPRHPRPPVRPAECRPAGRAESRRRPRRPALLPRRGDQHPGIDQAQVQQGADAGEHPDQDQLQHRHASRLRVHGRPHSRLARRHRCGMAFPRSAGKVDCCRTHSTDAADRPGIRTPDYPRRTKSVRMS